MAIYKEDDNIKVIVEEEHKILMSIMKLSSKIY